MSTVCHQFGASLLPLTARCAACGNVDAPPVSWTAVTLAPEAAAAASRAHPGQASPKGPSDTSGGGVALGPLVAGMSFRVRAEGMDGHEPLVARRRRAPDLHPLVLLDCPSATISVIRAARAARDAS